MYKWYNRADNMSIKKSHAKTLRVKNNIKEDDPQIRYLMPRLNKSKIGFNRAGGVD